MNKAVLALLVAGASATHVNWWSSFDRKGWSVCNQGTTGTKFMSGLYRNSCHALYCIEMADCNGEGGTQCYNANWSSSFDRKGWSTCKNGYFMAGLYRNTCHKLYCIEAAKCCKHTRVESAWKSCYDANWWGSFDRKGWSSCKSGYYMTGLYRNHCHDLYCLEMAKCCSEKVRPCRTGFKLTNGIDSKENYCNNGKHGVVCRATNGSGHWTPPTGCKKVASFPFAADANGQPCRVSCKFKWGWNLLKKNTQGKKIDIRDNFAPFKTEAIRVQRNGAIVAGWFRVSEIDAFGTDGKQIAVKGAQTDNYYGGWRKSVWAEELFDDSTRWGNDHGVHFQNHATIWFGKAVTIKQLRFVQTAHNGKYNQANWEWQFYFGNFKAPAVPTSAPTPAPTPAGEVVMNIELNTDSNFEVAKKALIKSLAVVYGVDASAIKLELSRRLLAAAQVLNVKVTITVASVSQMAQIKTATENKAVFNAAVASQLKSQGVVAVVETSNQVIKVDAPGVTQFPTQKPTAYPTAFPTAFPTSAPTGILSHNVCVHTICTYINGRTLVSTNTQFGEKWHCEKVGNSCKCVCHSSLSCNLRHHHTSGYKKTFTHC